MTQNVVYLRLNSLQDAKQAAFNGAVRGLSHQKWKQCIQGRYCVLNKGKPGIHCAIGWLVPWADQSENPNMDSCETFASNKLAPAFTNWLRFKARDSEKSEFRMFLSEMQRHHDSLDTSLGMRGSFVALGDRCNLVWPKDVK